MPQIPMRAALYLRVSTTDQTTDNQRRELTGLCQQRGWNIAKVYEDAGISGAKGRDKRSGFDALLKDATRGRVDVVVAWAIDRIGRSMSDLVATLQTLAAANVGLVLHQQALDTTTPAGRMVYHVAGAFAEFEREMIRSRVVAGMGRAKARGKRLGRPNVSAETEAAIRAQLKTGAGILKVSKALCAGSSTVQRSDAK